MFVQLLRETKLTKSESQWNIKHSKSKSFILKPAKALWCLILSFINKTDVTWLGLRSGDSAEVVPVQVRSSSEFD